MDSLPRPFTIEIDGKPIAKVNGPLDEQYFDGSLCTLAKTGSEPAVFELKECRLISDGLVLTRGMVEDRSLLPKKVYWFQTDVHQQMYHVVAEKEGDEYSLTISQGTFMRHGDDVLAALLPGQGGRAIAKMQS